MLQDILPHVYHNEYTPRKYHEQDLLLIYSEAGVLSAPDGLRLPVCGDFPDLPVRFAFCLDDRPVYLAMETPQKTEGWTYVPSKVYRDARPQEIAFICSVGESLSRWYASTAFCGRCGSPMADSQRERARVCPGCGRTVYPRINPAVIVAVTDGDRLLVTKYADRSFKRFALVAGFCEIGETVEETVRREVMEEVGLEVTNLRFYKSQPWVVTDSLLMGFFCDVTGNREPVLRDGELSVAQWVTRQEVPHNHSSISLTGEMMELFREGKEIK